MKIALVGDALSTRHLAPFGDPTWEIWGAGNGYTHLRRITRHFELHGWADVAETIQLDLRFRTQGGIETTFWEAPAKLGASHVYTGPEVPDRFVHNSDGSPIVKGFPFEEMLRLFPFRYFTSTFSWLIAFAISKEVTDLALYGFDLSLTEYATQKGSIEHFLGIAIGKGINVTVAPRSFILRTPFLYALETAASRRQRSVIMDQRYILERELANRQRIMDEAFYARLGAVNRLDEHKALCTACRPDAPCERRQKISQDFARAVTSEVKANTEMGQMKARLDENTYYARSFLMDDEGWPSPDPQKEDAGLPMFVDFDPKKAPYLGPTHSFPLPKPVAANLRPDGGLDFEIAEGPSITEVGAVLDGA